MTSSDSRIPSIDWLRGIVMVLMALDHARDYFGDFRVDPTALDTSTPALFFTRWITHFCAPTFVFLAGAGAWLYRARGRSTAEVSRFLWTRGLWLVVLEFTAVGFGWLHSFTTWFWLLQVIAAIGVAMLVLAALVWLPVPWVGAVGLLIVTGHNALDPLTPADFGAAGWLWTLLHEGSVASGAGPIPLPGGQLLLVVYPLLPWVGVMATGYAFAATLPADPARRRRRCLALGLGAVALFVAVRALGGYGNALPFAPRDQLVMTVASFLNCQKYPPSLAYLAMTLGPALVALALLDREPGRFGRALVTLGRVPLFFYLAHIYLISFGARALYWAMYGAALSPTRDFLLWITGRHPGLPDWYGLPLGAVYLAWIGATVALYPACAWYAGVKRRGRSPLWSYL